MILTDNDVSVIIESNNQMYSEEGRYIGFVIHGTDVLMINMEVSDVIKSSVSIEKFKERMIVDCERNDEQLETMIPFDLFK